MQASQGAEKSREQTGLWEASREPPAEQARVSTN